jgi:hypothetical protein
VTFAKTVAATVYTSKAPIVTAVKALFKCGGAGSQSKGILAAAQGATGNVRMDKVEVPFSFGSTIQVGDGLYGTIKSFKTLEYDFAPADLAGATR